jgi:hypothetical protein
MTFIEQLFRWLGAVVLATALGCAAAYHDYPCGSVQYGYCPPAPLPYAGYDACLTPVAVEHLGPEKWRGSQLEEPSELE